jgi:hypothetical protein
MPRSRIRPWGVRAIAVPALGFLLVAGACRPGTPVVDSGPHPPTTDGTISGSVVGPDGSSAGADRLIRATSRETGKVFETRTSVTGGYTMKVPPGHYTLTIDLRPPEKVVKSPGVVKIDSSDLDERKDFVISSGSR